MEMVENIGEEKETWGDTPPPSPAAGPRRQSEQGNGEEAVGLDHLWSRPFVRPGRQFSGIIKVIEKLTKSFSR
jgi:hypothetical protein